MHFLVQHLCQLSKLITHINFALYIFILVCQFINTIILVHQLYINDIYANNVTFSQTLLTLNQYCVVLLRLLLYNIDLYLYHIHLSIYLIYLVKVVSLLKTHLRCIFASFAEKVFILFVFLHARLLSLKSFFIVILVFLLYRSYQRRT